MCFNISNKYPDVKIAKRDIPCYKVLSFVNIRIISPIKGHTYFTTYDPDGSVYDIEDKFSFDYNYSTAVSIESGIHSFSNYKKAKRYMHDCTCDVIYKAIIPKGTEYYYNPEDHEYVSLKLTVIKGDIKNNSI